MCQNLIAFEATTTNPTIRENFISTRAYAMSFDPKADIESIDNSLKPMGNMRYMPTYEDNAEGRYLQYFVSEHFINSFILSSVEKEGKGNLMKTKADKIGATSCYDIAYLMFKNSYHAKKCTFDLYLCK